LSCRMGKMAPSHCSTGMPARNIGVSCKERPISAADLSGLHGHQPFSSLTLPMESPASCCPAWLEHLGASNSRVLPCSVVNHKRKEKTENTLNHTKPPQKKDAFLISFTSASNSIHEEAKATQGREDQTPQHYQRTKDCQENFVQIPTKTSSLVAISHFCLSTSLLPLPSSCKRTGRARETAMSTNCFRLSLLGLLPTLISILFAFSSEPHNPTSGLILDFEQHNHCLRRAGESPRQTIWRRAYGIRHEGRLAASICCKHLLACLHFSEEDLFKFPFFFP